VYSFAPLFNTERVRTRSWLNEMWNVEMEAAFMDVTDLVQYISSYIAFCIRYIRKHCKEDYAVLLRTNSDQMSSVDWGNEASFVCITYDEAVSHLVSAEVMFEDGPFKYGFDFSTQHMRY